MLTRTSSRPKVSIANSTAALAAASSRTSRLKGLTRSPYWKRNLADRNPITVSLIEATASLTKELSREWASMAMRLAAVSGKLKRRFSSTIVKAFFDESWVVPNPVVASDDGLSLVPYTGSDAGQMTLGGEMNKIAANVAIGRNHAGVHWRSDYAESLLLGEAVAISVLRDGRKCYNETFNGFTFTKFDGTQIAV